MSFIDTATGSPDTFELEVLEAFAQLGTTNTTQFCVMAGAAYLQQVMKRLSNKMQYDPNHFKQVGTASLIINTSQGRVYCQAVNDRYTDAWPLPWIVGADRKSTMPSVLQGSSPSQSQMVATICKDLEAFQGLYVPSGEIMPDEMIVRYAKPTPGVTDTPSGGDPMLRLSIPNPFGTKAGLHEVMVAVKQGRVSPVQQFSLDYPWKAPNKVTNYLAPTAGKPAPPPVVSKPVVPAGPKEKTLFDVMGERRKQSKWGG